jgi:hypothetical protein
VQDIPVRALRSISGRIVLRVSNEESAESGHNGIAKPAKANADKHANAAGADTVTYVPLAGVQIKAAQSIVKTDEAGNFLIRNLPAGKVTVSLVPVQPVPEGMKLPSGEVNLPADPVQVQGASVVISNPELVPYLTTHPVPGQHVPPLSKAAPILQAKAAAPTSPKLEPAQSELNSEAPAPQAERPIEGGQTGPKGTAVAQAAASSGLPNSVPATALPTPAPLSADVSRTFPASAAQVAPTRSKRPIVEWILTRDYCDHLGSLGEIADCYRMIKQIEMPNSQ